jgi:lipopolysaccharide export system permease protein
VRQRWREPDERTINELLSPDMNDSRDRESLREFRVEIHRRLVGPLLAPAFALLALSALLIGPADRRGQGRRIIIAAGSVIVVQGLFLIAFNLSRQSGWGLLLMYALAILPVLAGMFLITEGSENIRHKLLYRPGRNSEEEPQT